MVEGVPGDFVHGVSQREDLRNLAIVAHVGEFWVFSGVEGVVFHGLHLEMELNLIRLLALFHGSKIYVSHDAAAVCEHIFREMWLFPSILPNDLWTCSKYDTYTSIGPMIRMKSPKSCSAG